MITNVDVGLDVHYLATMNRFRLVFFYICNLTQLGLNLLNLPLPNITCRNLTQHDMD